MIEYNVAIKWLTNYQSRRAWINHRKMMLSEKRLNTEDSIPYGSIYINLKPDKIRSCCWRRGLWLLC